MRIYLAGPLFTQAERAWNAELAARLSAAGHEIFLPQEAIGGLEHLEADAIFRLDVGGVRSAEAVVAILDGADPDSGTCFECGLAFGLGIPVIAVRTDFRAGGDGLPGQKLSTINLMLSQSASAVVYLPAPALGITEVAAAVLDALAGVSSRPGRA